jgi:hypothetical protein
LRVPNSRPICLNLAWLYILFSHVFILAPYLLSCFHQNERVLFAHWLMHVIAKWLIWILLWIDQGVGG